MNHTDQTIYETYASLSSIENLEADAQARRRETIDELCEALKFAERNAHDPRIDFAFMVSVDEDPHKPDAACHTHLVASASHHATSMMAAALLRQVPNKHLEPIIRRELEWRMSNED